MFQILVKLSSKPIPSQNFGLAPYERVRFKVIYKRYTGEKGIVKLSRTHHPQYPHHFTPETSSSITPYYTSSMLMMMMVRDIDDDNDYYVEEEEDDDADDGDDNGDYE